MGGPPHRIEFVSRHPVTDSVIVDPPERVQADEPPPITNVELLLQYQSASC